MNFSSRKGLGKSTTVSKHESSKQKVGGTSQEKETRVNQENREQKKEY